MLQTVLATYIHLINACHKVHAVQSTTVLYTCMAEQHPMPMLVSKFAVATLLLIQFG